MNKQTVKLNAVNVISSIQNKMNKQTNKLEYFKKNDLSWIEKSEKNKILHSFERLTLNYELTNFIPLQKNISEYITNCYENKFQMKILLESLGLEIKLSKEDIENEFFDLL